MQRFLLLLACVVAVNALAPLHKAKERIQGQYIVVLKDDVDVDTEVTGIGAISGSVNIKNIFRTVANGFSAILDDQALLQIRNLVSVSYVEEDGIVRTTDVGSWGIDRVNQRYLPLDGDIDYKTGDGKNAHAYIIDTGINPNHADFGKRAVQDYGNEDCNGHGTHCAGTIGSSTYGVATGVTIHGVQVLGCLGSGSWSEVIAGCDYVSENAKKPAVASLSLGGGKSPTVDAAIKRMVDAGITVVVAAGNDNSDACGYSPAGSPEAITVGATEKTDVRSYFSNYGECVNIFAPGTDITSTWYTSKRATNTISGTSMACPHVAGAAALHLSNDNSMKPTEVAGKIYSDATPDLILDPQGPNNLLLYVP
ncbi:extracellular serine proteinase-like [Antedon mediterranea]|uniref:extracellular serine proteinase-like n=1 Tax=Antedon mediterranea TaxID=105859 RepID=UPI003AF98C27